MSPEERRAKREREQAEASERARAALGAIPLRPQGGTPAPANVRGFAQKNFKEPDGQVLANDQRWIDISLLDPNPFQPEGRLNPEELQGMVESFEREGQLQAVEVRPQLNPLLAGRFELAFGHRRQAAVRAGANAGIKQPQPHLYIGKLLCVVRPGLSDLEMLRRAIAENNDRLTMAPLQAATMYASMRELTTQEMRGGGELAIGKEASWRQVAEWNGYGATKYSDLSRVAALLDLPKEMRQYFQPEPGEADPEAPKRAVLNSRHGRALLQFRNDARQQKALLRAILSENLAGAQAEKRAEDMRKAQPTALDLEVTEAVKRQMREERAGSAGLTRDANRRALDEGRSHLSAVPATGGDASADEQAEPFAEAASVSRETGKEQAEGGTALRVRVMEAEAGAAPLAPVVEAWRAKQLTRQSSTPSPAWFLETRLQEAHTLLSEMSCTGDIPIPARKITLELLASIEEEARRLRQELKAST